MFNYLKMLPVSKQEVYLVHKELRDKFEEISQELSKISKEKEEYTNEIKEIKEIMSLLLKNIEESNRIINQAENNNSDIKMFSCNIFNIVAASRAWKTRTMKLPVLSFEVHLTEHCNLNCAGCDHFSPLAEPQFADIDNFTKDFERLSELFCGEAREIFLLGGEPLLNPNIEKFCFVARKCFCDAIISIVTNGILLSKMPESFWRTCRDQKITIRPTKYPIQIDYEKIEKIAKEYGVEFIYMNDATQIKTMVHNVFDLKGLQDPRESFIDCSRANRCIYLADGKLYPCTIAPNIHHFNKFFGQQMVLSERDYINIYNAQSADEIFEFLSQPIPFCRYCSVKDAKLNQPWQVSQKRIEEWT